MWRQKHVLDIRSLEADEIRTVFELSDRFLKFLQQGVRRVPALKDYAVVTLFFEPSTRTRISFELAARHLSAQVVHFEVSSSSLRKGESLKDTLLTLNAQGFDMAIVRHRWVGTAHWIASQTPMSVINAGDGTHAHPTQALIDAYTVHRFMGAVKDVRVGIVGDILHSRVARSDAVIFQKLGAEVMLCGPPALLPSTVERPGIRLTHRLEEVLQWADVVIALRLQRERQRQGLLPSLEAYYRDYAITEERLQQAGRPIKVMHPGPVNRDVEIEASIVEDPSRSWILPQVRHGVAVRMALLYLLAQRRSSI